jgi:uncharacterized Zn finger protein
MVVFVICPFCLQETREHIVKTESAYSDAERIDPGDNDLVYYRCENCDKVWIEFKNVNDSSK